MISWGCSARSWPYSLLILIWAFDWMCPRVETNTHRPTPTFFRCMIFSPWFHVPYTEDYATVSITLDANGTFVHEAGHCLGAFHDRYTSMGQGVISSIDDDEYYNYGYCLPGNKYATVMSYEYNCPTSAAGDDVEEILYFSNPDVSFEGVPTGDSLNNNAKAIRETRDETSQYGTNCYDGFPEPGSAMGEKVCAWTPWTGFEDWGECCCAEDWTDCPLVADTNTSKITKQSIIHISDSRGGRLVDVHALAADQEEQPDVQKLSARVGLQVWLRHGGRR